MFELTKEAVREALGDNPALNTLTNQFELDVIWDMLEDKGAIDSDEKLFNALMDVMYKTRPQGIT
jgi:hypothetical protein